METNPENEIILYQPDDTPALDVRVEDESVWLNRNLEFAGLLFVEQCNEGSIFAFYWSLKA